MKKLLGIVASVLALGTLFVSCASTGGAKKDAADVADLVPAVPHPRNYEVDPADGCASIECAYNQYGPNYQAACSENNLYKFLKADKPQAGDTVTIKAKITSDTDLPALTYYLIDNSAQANYWTLLSDDFVVLNVKAGEPVEIEQEIPVTTNVKGGFQVIFCYDGKDHGQDAYDKVGKVAKLSFEKVGNTTDTSKESAELGIPSAAPTGPRTFDVKLSDVAKMVEIAPNASNGTLWNYQYIGSITDLFDPDYLPVAGDTIHITFKGTSDHTIDKPVLMTIVENTAAVGWWKDLVSTDSNTKFQTFAEAGTIVAGEPFTAEATFTLGESATEGLSVQMFYDVYDGASGCIWIYSKD